MSNLYDKSLQIQKARDDIKLSLENKGQVVTNDLRTYSDIINSIKINSKVVLYNSLSEMYSSTNLEEGTKALVYNNLFRPLTENDKKFKSIYVPYEIHLNIPLPEVSSTQSIGYNISGSAEMEFSTLWINYSNNSVGIGYEWKNKWDSWTYSYDSQNLILTANKAGDMFISFNGNTITYRSGDWDNIYSEFITLYDPQFLGIYEYKNNQWDILTTQFDIVPNYYVFEGNYFDYTGICTGYGNFLNGISAPGVRFYNNYFNNLNNTNIEIKGDLTDLFNAMKVSINNSVNLAFNYIYNFNYITNASRMFSHNYNYTYSDLVNLNLNLDVCKNTSYMFYQSNISDFPEYNLNNVIDMSYMFGESNIVNVPNFNTTNVKNMSGTFEYCYKLLEMPSFNTSNVTNMANMFHGAEKISSVINYNTTNVKDMLAMLQYCMNITSVPNFDTSNVTNMAGMFSYCDNLISIPNFDTSNVTNMSDMLQNCGKLTTVPYFNTSNVTNMCGMFNNCVNLVDVPNFDTSNVTNMVNMFQNCTKLVEIPEFNTINVREISRIVSYCNYLSNNSIQNIINMCLNSNVQANWRYLNTQSYVSPFRNTKFNNTYYQNRWEELTAAGWTY